MKTMSQSEYREYRTAASLLLAFATTAGFILQNERLSDTEGDTPFDQPFEVIIRNTSMYAKAFKMLVEALGLPDPFYEDKQQIRDDYQEKADAIRADFDRYKNSVKDDRQRRINGEEALRQRVVSAFASAHEFVRLLEETDATHKQREGQLTLLHKHLENLREMVLFPVDDIPF